MNFNETAAILALFSTNWPNHEVTENTVHLWATACKDLDPQAALEGAQDVLCEDSWFPSIARLRDATERHAHAIRNQAAIDRGLAPAPDPNSYPSKERVAEIIANLRAQLTAVGGRNHWHGGPDPCPVCGGEPT